VRHISLPEPDPSACQCGTCPTVYSMSTLSPSVSPCSSVPGDMSPNTIWGSNLNAQIRDFYQSSLDGASFETPQTTMEMGTSPEHPPFLEQVDLSCCSFRIPVGVMCEGTVSAGDSTSSLEGPFAAFEAISTVASRNERRKAQNRAAQRAFRGRQQQALAEANLRMRALQKEKDEAVGKKDHFERLFKSLSQEHERLLDKFHELLASVNSSPLGT